MLNLAQEILNQANDILADFRQGRVKGWFTGNHTRFVLQILLSTAQRYLHYLNVINSHNIWKRDWF